MRLGLLITFLVLLVVIGAGPFSVWLCSQEQPTEWAPQRIERPHLPNALRLHEKVISGAQPEGEAGFRELSELGVKTILSVDGARPDLDLARKHGLRYVHLPHGYDGISAQRAEELAKAVRDLPGPIYVHCHHGKHRSPAAAAVACVGAGLLPPEKANAVLESAGTSKNYRGLYDAAKQAHRWDDATLDKLPIEFRSSVELPPMAEAMVEIEQVHDRLLAIQQARWQAPSDHPDLDPPHEALLLREQFTELARTKEARQQPAEFLRMLSQSERAARELESSLRAPLNQTRATASLELVSKNCAACHARYRDTPPPSGSAHHSSVAK